MKNKDITLCCQFKNNEIEYACGISLFKSKLHAEIVKCNIKIGFWKYFKVRTTDYMREYVNKKGQLCS